MDIKCDHDSPTQGHRVTREARGIMLIYSDFTLSSLLVPGLRVSAEGVSQWPECVHRDTEILLLNILCGHKNNICPPPVSCSQLIKENVYPQAPSSMTFMAPSPHNGQLWHSRRIFISLRLGMAVKSAWLKVSIFRFLHKFLHNYVQLFHKIFFFFFLAKYFLKK